MNSKSANLSRKLLLILVQLPCSSSMVWSCISARDLHNPFHTNRYRHGYHKPTQQYLSNLPARLRSSLSRPPGREHGFRDLRIYLLCTRHKVLGRSQTRPLYENPSQNPLPSSNGGHDRLLHHSNRCLELDVRQCSQYLHATSH